MKKNIFKSFFAMILLVGVLTLTGCGKKNNVIKDKINSQINSGKELVKKSKDSIDNKVVKGLKGMLQGGTSLKCVSNDDNGNQFVTYTNGKKFKTEGIEDGKKSNMLFVDGVSYVWDDTTKKGMKMDKKCIEDFQKNMGIENKINKEEDGFDFSIDKLEKDEEKGKIKCSPSTEADFSVPNDVTFTDQCAILKQQMEKYKDQIKTWK